MSRPFNFYKKECNNMGYAIMRFSKIKSVNTGNGVMRHIRREVDIKTLSHPERKNINILTEPIKEKYQNKTFNEILKDRLNGTKPRANAVYGLEFIFAYTPGCLPEQNLKAWSMASTQFLIDIFGIDNVISVTLHMDEQNPHIHAVVLPIDNKGKLNCKYYINGPAACRELQDKYYEMVKDYGDLQRGINSKITKRIHESNRRWIARNADKEIHLEAYQRTFGTADTWSVETSVKFEMNKGINFQLSDRAI